MRVRITFDAYEYSGLGMQKRFRGGEPLEQLVLLNIIPAPALFHPSSSDAEHPSALLPCSSILARRSGTRLSAAISSALLSRHWHHSSGTRTEGSAMSSVSLLVAALRMHWASWEARTVEELGTAWGSCALDDVVDAVVDSSAHAAMTHWIFIVIQSREPEELLRFGEGVGGT